MTNYKYLTANIGRPTKFKKEYIEKLVEFFDIEPTRKELMEVVTEFDSKGNQKKTAEKYKHIPNKFPTLVQFAKSIGVSYWSLQQWANKGQCPVLQEKLAKNEGLNTKEVEMMKNLVRFSNAYKSAKDLQQDFLMQNGLVGASPSSAYIFTAKNVSGMRDKVENDVNVRQVKPLLDNLNMNVHNNDSDEENSGS